MKIIVTIAFFLLFFRCFSQQLAMADAPPQFGVTTSGHDSLAHIDTAFSYEVATAVKPFPAKPVHHTLCPLVAPVSMIGYGMLALNNHSVRQLDWSTKKMIGKNTRNFKCSVDDYLQYSPAIAVYGLNAMGIKGKNNFADRTIMYGLTAILTGISVTGLKHMNAVTRPDGSAANSFPSGHTTTAFAAAEFLHQEYKNQSVWYSVGGYAAATATGILRMYNNRHFLSDVVCGAGLGMLSTKLVYLVYPAIKRKFTKHTPITTLP